MEVEHVENAIRVLRAIPAPVPGEERFRADVWREIRHRSALVGSATPPAQPDLILFKTPSALLLRLVAIPFIAGLLIVWVVVLFGELSRERERARLTRAALDLGVFSAEAEGLPHAKLFAGQ